MPNAKVGRLIAAVIILVGAVLLIAAVFTPWYAEQFSGSGVTVTQNAYPGLPSSNGTIQYTCSGLPSGVSCLSQTSYNTYTANNTGNIAEAVYFMAIAGFILGFIGAIIGLMSRSNPRRTAPAMALAVVAMILAVAAVGVFAVALPGAIGSDSPNHSGTGPWSSFFGSTNTGRFDIQGTLTWGPGVGWYLAIGAFVLLLVGVILALRFRRDPLPPVPATTPAPGAMPSASPPPAS
jgi:hypothetical protein